MHALVIDDSRAMRLMLRRILEGLTFKVTEFSDADSGWAWLQRGGSADIALVDWNMPGMSGLEFIRSVRAVNIWEQMFLMMVTSETAPERLRLALDAGADEYLMKPITPEVLQQKLEILGFRWARETIT